ncbi:MAG: cytochrome b/b6 domain-containing protein [Thermoleophilia bacterium]|nr:cytochrome b/b6 domain-containing protein [Thermoleophilia bacterium]
MAGHDTGAPARVARFTLTERLLHWIIAASFFAMLVTGAFLYFPMLAQYLARPTAKSVHLWAAIVMFASVPLVPLLGNRRAVAQSVHDVQWFDSDDVVWLTGAPSRLLARPHLDPPPQGRFNAGQKLNTVISAGLLCVLGITGLLLWLGERDTSYRLAGSVAVHDLTSVVIVFLVFGHMYLAMVHPSTRHAMRGMITGKVDRGWATEHHAKWLAELDAESDPAGR